MLGHRFAAEPARDRANGCTHDGAYRSSSDRAGRRTGSDTACRCSKADSNRVRTRGASDRVTIRPSLSCGVIVHVILRCTVEHSALSIAMFDVKEYRPKDEILVGQTRSAVGRCAALVQCRHSFRQIHQTIGLKNDVAHVCDCRAQNVAGVRNRVK
jgi:hypothetical protein